MRCAHRSEACGGVQRVYLPRREYPVLVQALEHFDGDGRERSQLGVRSPGHSLSSAVGELRHRATRSGVSTSAACSSALLVR